MPNVKLQDPYGETFEVDIEIIICSIIIRAMLKNLHIYEEEEEVGVVPLLNINPAILNKIIQRYIYDKNGFPPPPEIKRARYENEEYCADDIDSYYAEFVKAAESTCFDLILAANYLRIKDLINITDKIVLLNITCQTVADMVKGKTSEEFRKPFNINDYIISEEGLERCLEKMTNKSMRKRKRERKIFNFEHYYDI
ncbi:S-phase kinase-associated protein 1 [Camponotus floridanus]|uniref:S-phase kinase-associated protein 1 n=1 Tax=Camponotus floridanus TaxID=104421 RepID=E2AIP2_CAMFO|nr:S-phase kinase-associated protein 1 [Camponotus floridanus]